MAEYIQNLRMYVVRDFKIVAIDYLKKVNG